MMKQILPPAFFTHFVRVIVSTTFFLCVSISAYSQAGTAADPFTSLSQATCKVTTAGIYHFDIGGTTFSSYVDANGYVLLAIDFGNGVGNMPQGTSLSLGARGILSPTVLASLTEMDEIRISSSTGNVDATNTNTTLVNRVINNQTLSRGAVDNGVNNDWTGTNAARLTRNASCNSNLGSNLHQNVFHACGNPFTLIWSSSGNYQREIWFLGEISSSQSLRLWGRAEDKTPPVLSQEPADITVSCLDDIPPIPNITATDNCDTSVSVDFTETTQPTCPDGSSFTRTWEAEDSAGNTVTHTQTITVEELDDFTLPADGSEEIGCAEDLSTPTPPVVEDSCGTEITPTGPTISATPECEGDVTYVWTYEDCEGNSHDWTYTYTIEYADFTLPADGSEEIGCAEDLSTPTPPVVEDSCGTEITPTGPTISATPECEGDVTYVWTYEDCEGNSHDWTYTYTIEYADFTLPADGSEEIGCADDLSTPTPPVVEDSCGTEITPTGPTISATPECEGDVTYVWTYEDCEGNSHDWTYTYTIEYADFTLPADGSEEIGCADDLSTPTPPVVEDSCGTEITPTGPTISAAPECEGDVTYVWTYEDCEGNSHDWTYTYTIEYADFTLPADGSEEIGCADDLSTPTPPVVEDSCGTEITPTGPTISATPECEGDVTYVWTYEDCEGNSHDWTYTYTIEYADFTLPADGSEEIGCADDLSTPTPPVVEDSCGTEITPTGPTISATPECEGDVTYVWTYEDCEGNSHDWTYTYTIEYADFTLPADGSEEIGCADDLSTPTPPVVEDSCGTEITPTGPTISATPECEGDVTYVWTYEDCEGNSHDWTYTYTIEYADFTLPADGSEEIGCADDLSTPTPPVVEDSCGTEITPTGPTISATPECEGDVTYVWTYEDCEGNSHDWTYTYTIEYADFTLPADGSEEIGCADDLSTPTPPVVEDSCGTEITPTGPTISATPECEGDVTYVWTYEDCEGNSHDWTYTYTIEYADFTLPADGSEEIGCADDLSTPTPPVVEDSCGTEITPTGPTISATPECEGDVTYVWTYEDCEGNSHDWTYTYTIEYADFTLPADGSEEIGCADDLSTPTPPVVEDSCGTEITPTGPTISATPECEGDVTYVWTYEDCEGNSHDWTYTYTIEYADFTLPADGSEEIGCADDLSTPTPPVVEDSCGTEITPTGPTISATPECEGDVTYVWTYEDCEGNSHDWTYTYTIEYADFTLPADGSEEIGCADDLSTPTPPVVEDSCGTEITPTGPTISATPECEGDVTYVWTYEDCEGNSHDWTYTYTIEYADFTLPADGSEEIGCAEDLSTPTPPVVEDSCGTEITPTGPTISATPECEGDVTYVWTYEDCEGNSHDWTYTYTIEYADFTLPADGSEEIGCADDLSTPTPPVVEDSCGTEITPTGPTISATPECEGDVTYVWTYEDCEGNSHDWTYTYTIEYADFTLPADGSEEIGCADDLSTPTPPVVEDSCGTEITPTGPTISATPECEGDVTYVWTYEDCEGNSHDWTYTYTIEYADFTLPADGSEEIGCADDLSTPTPPVVEDSCGTEITPTGPTISATPECEGDVTYVWTYEDCEGNSHDWTYTYTIEYADFTLPADGSEEIGCADDLSTPTPPVVEDSCGTEITPTGPTISATPECEGDVTYVWTYEDCEGNSHDWTYTYTIEYADFTLPADGSEEIGCADDLSTPTPPVVEDSCGTEITPTGPTISATPECEGDVTYVWTYEDCEGNSHDWTYTYTIEYADFTLPADGSEEIGCADDLSTPTPPVVEDSCGTEITPTGPTISATPECEGDVTYVWTYEDCEGNSHDWTYTYTIEYADFTLPADGSEEIGCADDLSTPTPPVVEDSCGTEITPTGPTISATPECEGDVTYVWTYEDCEGNSHDWTYTYTIEYADFTLPADGSEEIGCADDLSTPTPPVVEDSCGTEITPTGPTISATPECEGDVTYVWTYEDCEGNSHDWTYTYTIEYADFTLPADGSEEIGCAEDLSTPTPPVVEDSCGTEITPTGPTISATPECEGDVTYVWTYEDCEGNSHDWTYTYTIEYADFTLPADGSEEIGCADDLSTPTPPVVEDSCGTEITPTGPTISATPECEGDVTYVWTYEDCEGNSHDWTYTYTIEYADFTLPADGSEEIGCADDLSTPTPPVVEDSCGTEITPTGPTISATPECEGDVTYVWTYEDCEGNSHDWTYTYTIEYADFTLPADGSEEIGCADDLSTPTPPVVEDSCGTEITPTGPTISATPECEGDVTYVWTYEDCEGNSHDWTYTYTIEYADFTLPADGSEEIGCADDLSTPTPPVVEDSCGTEITPTGPTISATPECEGDVTYVWTYEDCEGNSHDWTYTYTIEYADFTLPADGSEEIGCADDLSTPTPPVVEDSCGTEITPTGPTISATPECEGDVTYVWTYEDCEGNSHDWTYTYTIEYADFTLPADGSEEIGCADDLSTPTPPVVEDSCGTEITPTGPTISATPECEGDVTYVWTYEDCEGNSHDWTYTYTIEYADFTLPADGSEEIGCADDLSTPTPPVVEDSCGTEITPTGPTISATPECEGDVTYVWTYEDCEGNSHDWTYTYTIEYADFTLPADGSEEIGCADDLSTPTPPVVEDSCGTEITPTGPTISATPECEGDVTYVWTYEDCEGNSHDWTYTYTIEYADFTLPADGSEEIGCADDLSTPTPPVVEDSCGTEITPTGPTISATPECEGDVTYVWTYEDCEGNSHDWTYTYTIEYADFTLPADGSEEIGCAEDLSTPTPPVVEDSCGTEITPTGPTISATPECEGDVTYVWTYEDCEGNSHDWTYTYTIEYADFTLPADGSEEIGCAEDLSTPTPPVVEDSCGTEITPTGPTISATPECEGDVTYVWTYEDCEGNSHDWTYTYTIEYADFTLPADGSEEIGCADDLSTPTPPVVEDSCGTEITPTGPTISATPECEGDVTYVWTYEDCEGNSHDWTYTYTIEYADFTLPADGSEEIGCADDLSTPTPPVVEDSCGTEITPTGPTISATPECEGDVTYVWTYEDCEGNSHDWTYTYTIEYADFTLPADGSEEIGCADDLSTPTPPVVEDSCGTEITPTGPTISATPECEGDVTYVWTYEDCEGNSHDWTYTYTIEYADFTLPADGSEEIGCADDLSTPTPPVVEDSCGTEITPTGPTISATPECEGDVTYVWTYEDCEGNSHDWTYTYTIEYADFTLPADGSEEIGCAEDLSTPTPPVVEDSCGTEITPTGPTISATPECEGDVTYVWTYEDCEGNSHDWTYTYTIEYADFTLPADGSEEIGCADDLSTPTPPVVEDSCGTEITPTGPTISATPECEGDVTYVWTYEDCEGNSHDWTYTYTIEYADFTLPADGSEEIGCADDLSTPTPPVVEDSCGTEITPTGPTISATPECEGDVTYVWTYEDCEGNSHDWTYTYTIEYADFTLPADGSEEIGCAEDLSTPTPPVVEDSCGTEITPTGPTISATPECEGDVTYVWTYEDCEGNSHDWTYTYTIEYADFTLPADGSEEIGCAEDLSTPTPPVVEDSCGTEITPTGPTISATPECEGDVTYVWTYEDCEGNSHDWTYTYTIEYADFTLPADGSEEIGCADDLSTPTPPVVEDSCGTEITPTGPTISATPECEGDVTYVWTYEDCEGNSHDWTYTYTIEYADFTLPADGSEEIGCADDLSTPTPPVVEDSCGTEITPTGPTISATPECEGDVTYVWTYEDCEGNSHDWTYTYTIEYADFTLPADGSEEIGCADDLSTPTPPVVEDSCGTEITPTGPTISATPECEGDVTYVWTYEDCEGNSHDWTYTYTIEYADFTLPADGSEEIGCADDLSTPTPPVVEDSCGTEITPTGPTISATPECEGDVTYVWTYEDCEGNSHDWTYTYTIEYADFTLPADGSEEIGCAEDLSTPTPPVVEDSCGTEITPTGPTISATPECEGDVTYVWTYEDCEGNSHDWTYTYTIEYADFTLPADGSEEIGCADDLSTPTPPVVEDSCGTEITPTGPTISATPECEGDVTYVWTYEDCEGNSHDWTYTYTIEYADFTLPADGSEEIGCADDLSTPTPPVVEDSCGTEITPTGPTISATPECEGDVTYVWTYEDCEGNSHDWTYTYTIDDNTAPTGTAPAGATLLCGEELPVADIELITDEADNCGGMVTVTVEDNENGGTGCGTDTRIVTRTYTLEDCAGNAAELNQLFTFESCPLPVIQNIEYDNSCQSGEVIVSSDITSNVTYTCLEAEGAITEPLTQDSNIFNLGGASEAKFVVTNTETGCISAEFNVIFGCGVLPVKLTVFEVSEHENGNLVYWETASELNNDYFEVQRSVDGFNFETIAIIDGSGTTSQTQTYSYLDENSPCGLIYYRLKQVDFDNAFEYTDIVSIEVECADDIVVYPNPFFEYLKVQFDAPKEGMVQMKMINALGQIVDVSDHEVRRGRNVITINGLGENSTGVYFLVIESEDGLIGTKEIVKDRRR